MNNQNMPSKKYLEVSAAARVEVGSHADRNIAWTQCRMRE